MLLGLDDAIHPALALSLFGANQIGAHQAQQQIECVVEVAFLFPLIVLAAHGVRDVGQEGDQHLAEMFQFSSLQSHYGSGHPALHVILRIQIAAGQQGDKPPLDFVVGEIYQEGVGVPVIVFNGQVSALENHGKRFLHIGAVVHKLVRGIVFARELVDVLVEVAQ